MKRLKILLSLIIFAFAVLPSQALMDIKISKDYYYDTQSTIMSDIEPQKQPTNDEFWTKNIFHLGKYRPFYMLSNKELYNLMPEQRINVSQQIHTPSVYNISLKTASVTNVSLSPAKAQRYTAGKKVLPKAIAQNKNEKLLSLYKQAKIQNVDIDNKIDTAILLKNSKIKSNYKLAFNLLNDVISIDPYNANAYYIKAELCIAENDSANAIKNYAEALKINPLSKQCCLGLAKVLEPKNKELAKKYYNLAKND